MSNIVVSLNGVTISRKSSKRLDNDLLLTDINLQVERGELVYIIGKVGCGKSTLLKVLYGEFAFDKGSGQVAGFDLDRLRRKDIPFLRRRLGIVFQDFQLLPDRTAYDNLVFALKATGWRNRREIEARINQVLLQVKLAHKAYKMPHQLSGGEQQRLTIARALLNNPDVILADEPTGNLDPSASRDIILLFQEIAEMGCGVIIASHDIKLIEDFPSRTMAFDQGTLFEVDLSED